MTRAAPKGKPTSRCGAQRGRLGLPGRGPAELRRLHQQVDSGVIPDDKLTVQAFLDRWLTVNLPGAVAESTAGGYVDTVRLDLIPGS